MELTIPFRKVTVPFLNQEASNAVERVITAATKAKVAAEAELPDP